MRQSAGKVLWTKSIDGNIYQLIHIGCWYEIHTSKFKGAIIATKQRELTERCFQNRLDYLASKDDINTS